MICLYDPTNFCATIVLDPDTLESRTIELDRSAVVDVLDDGAITALELLDTRHWAGEGWFDETHAEQALEWARGELAKRVAT